MNIRILTNTNKKREERKEGEIFLLYIFFIGEDKRREIIILNTRI